MSWFCFVFFFFFKQKTAYELRISDWSSDVCSSDLLVRRMFSENLDGALFPGGIAGAYPQQQAAPHNLLVEILRMMLSEPFGEHRTDQSAGTSCERGPGDNREQGSAGGHDGPHRGERKSVV